MRRLSRRRFLVASAALGAVSFAPPARAASHGATTKITIGTRTIEVKKKAAKVFGLMQPDGTHGLIMNAGERFRVRLKNDAGEAALIHWHGLTPPNDQDGVSGVTQPALEPGQSYEYDFTVALPGTNWMHSHHVLQEQSLMAAPLIVRDPKDAARDEQEVVILLHDFTFEMPDRILSALSKGMSHDHGAMAPAAQDPHAGHDMSNMDMSGMDMPHDMSQMNMAGMDLNDVSYDAFLANDRTLDDPEVVRVDKGQRVRLRVINAASATNFMIDLGPLSGSLTDVDGRPIVPVMGNRFPLAIAQRADVRFTLPVEEGAWPVLFQREGDTALTGVVLATKSGTIAKIADQAHQAIGAIDRAASMLYEAAEPLPERRTDRELKIDLTGSMMTYRWGIAEKAAIAHHAHLMVQEGERVEMMLTNRTEMSHPMHLHGHHFQVVAVNGSRVKGAVRDTELVPIGGSVTLAFDAFNPGKWMFHCHNLYHMLSGMMTQVRYL
ncbi:multicopper oxidase family protein [Dongia deserti]|uniref:multicopper oxidase family protein n=1 Tax=Dongia deserti TaxID=2268030 RepID=UPI000E65D4A0|nr:multicopper oxidase domain-containing protein [Dongia deserti]